MANRNSAGSIDAYILAAAADAREALAEIRQTVHRCVPAATETLSYQMPAFRLRRTFIYFGAFKRHIGVYPPVTDDDELIRALAPYRGVKGNLQFRLKEPIPRDLIERTVRALVEQYG